MQIDSVNRSKRAVVAAAPGIVARHVAHVATAWAEDCDDFAAYLAPSRVATRPAGPRPAYVFTAVAGTAMIGAGGSGRIDPDDLQYNTGTTIDLTPNRDHVSEICCADH